MPKRRPEKPDRQTSSVVIFAQASERLNKPSQRVREIIMTSREAMAEEIRRLSEKVRALEARDIDIEREADCADVVMITLMDDIEVMRKQQQDMVKIQDWKADQTEELAKSAMAVKQRLEYLMKRDVQSEARFKASEERSKASEARLKALEDQVNALRGQPAAKKMPKPPAGPPPKKAKAVAKAVEKAATKPSNVTKYIVVKTPPAKQTEPSL